MVMQNRSALGSIWKDDFLKHRNGKTLNISSLENISTSDLSCIVGDEHGLGVAVVGISGQVDENKKGRRLVAEGHSRCPLLYSTLEGQSASSTIRVESNRFASNDS